MHVPGPYRPDADAAGKRALQGAALGLLSRLDGGAQAARQYAEADNMTRQFGTLDCLLATGKGAEELAAFRTRWGQDRLVVDKWFRLQIAHAAPEHAASVTETLTGAPDFNWKNPNCFRAVIGALTMNPAGFHDPTGASYRLVADWLIRLDAVNPQITARMSAAFETWRRYDTDRQGLIRAELTRIAGTGGLSRNTGEMINRILNG